MVFTPTANGTAAGTLTVSSPVFMPATVTLSGAGGLAGSVQMMPGLLTFPATGVGATSSAQTVTVTNSGGVTLTSLTLAASTGFQIANNACPASLSPGASCTTGVTFAPAQTGQQSGSLTVASSAMAAGAQVSLSGTGFDFTAAVGGQSGQTVASGQTASFTLNLAPQGGTTATFTFQCGTLPANASCTFNPASDAVPANATSHVTVQIATGQAAVAAQVRHPYGWSEWPVACGLVLLPLAWRRRRKWLMGIAGLVLAGGLSSCAGAGGGTGLAPSSPALGATPAGTYSVVW